LKFRRLLFYTIPSHDMVKIQARRSLPLGTVASHGNPAFHRKVASSTMSVRPGKNRVP
jgi:hypothetical protein